MGKTNKIMIIRAEVQSHSIYSRGTDRQKEIQQTIWWEAIVDAVLPDSPHRYVPDLGA